MFYAQYMWFIINQKYHNQNCDPVIFASHPTIRVYVPVTEYSHFVIWSKNQYRDK